MFVIVNRFLLRKGFWGIALWPFIIVKEKHLKENPVFLNHERIHLRQQAELFVLFFYLWYVTEFVVRYFQHKNKNAAYRSISFEIEAYTHEKDLDYLKNRSFWSFLKYL
nr:hypothetical protein [Ulvibacter litoralis]